MTTSEETMPPPPVRQWPLLHLDGTDFDPLLAELMREGPVARVQLPNGEGWAWLLTRHEDVRTVTDDPRFSRREVAGREVTRLAPHDTARPGALTFLDTAEHARLRQAVEPAFAAERMERLRGDARRTLEELVGAMLREGPPADLVERVLEPFPAAVGCEVMGVPEQDRAAVRAWAGPALAAALGAGAGAEARQAMEAYFAELIARRGAGGGEDVVSLLGAEVAGGGLGAREAAALAVRLQLGGEAIAAHTGQTLFLLLTRPGLLERLRAEPAGRPRALEELLRYVPHRHAVGLSRIATEDVVLHGVRIRAGDAVYVSYLAANRDPEVFPDPEWIDVDRDPNPHLAFGHGAHHCAGAPLARLEAELLLETVLERVPGLRLAVEPQEVRWRRGSALRGPETLPVTW